MTRTNTTRARKTEFFQRPKRRASTVFALLGVSVLTLASAGCSILDSSGDSSEAEATGANTTTTGALLPPPTPSTVPDIQTELQAPPEVAPAAAAVSNFVVTKPEVCAQEVAAFNVEYPTSAETAQISEIDSGLVERANELVRCLQAAGEPQIAQAVVVLKDWALQTASQ